MFESPHVTNFSRLSTAQCWSPPVIRDHSGTVRSLWWILMGCQIFQIVNLVRDFYNGCFEVFCKFHHFLVRVFLVGFYRSHSHPKQPLQAISHKSCCLMCSQWFPYPCKKNQHGGYRLDVGSFFLSGFFWWWIKWMVPVNFALLYRSWESWSHSVMR